jgi:hypothetical protein
VVAVLAAHAAGEEGRDQLVALHPVVEGIDQPLEGLAAARPLVQRRRVGRVRDPSTVPKELLKQSVKAGTSISDTQPVNLTISRKQKS